MAKRLEYIQFSSSLSELLTGLNLSTKLHVDNNKSNYNELLNANQYLMGGQIFAANELRPKIPFSYELRPDNI